MRTRYDPEADALYVRFTETEVVDSEEVSPGVVLDFDQDGKIVAIEFLGAASQIAPGADLEHLRTG
jgi:uncharacterized protein YuzE